MAVGDRGYETRYEPKNPNAYVNGMVRVHRAVMAEVLGRPLVSAELVHHVDGNKANNVLENLAVVTRVEHPALHVRKGNGREGSYG